MRHKKTTKYLYSPVIRSSEIAQYIYDPKLWWEARTKGVEITKDMIEGEKIHESYQQRYQTARGLDFAKRLVLVAIIVLILLYVLFKMLPWS